MVPALSAPSGNAITGGPGAALRAYCDHFSARDAEALVELFSDQALLEIPLLDHHVRGAEIAPALLNIVSALRSCEITVRVLAETERAAIGEGHLQAQTEALPMDFTFAMVVEVDEAGRIARVSEYFDTDSIKPLD